jgi:hypothetical protein
VASSARRQIALPCEPNSCMSSRNSPACRTHDPRVEPQNEAWWINLAYSVRQSEEGGSHVCCRRKPFIPVDRSLASNKVAIIAFNLACYASATGRMGEAKDRLRNAIELDSLIRCQFAPKITRQFTPENHPPLR